MNLSFTFRFRALLLLSLFTVILAFNSCQDDPVLDPIGGENPIDNPKTRAFITYIQLRDFPATDPNGIEWDTVNLAETDTFGNADIFFNITTPDPDPPVLWSQESHFENVGEFDTTTFYLVNEFEVVPFGSPLALNIYDFELPDSTLMGTVNFETGPYPDPSNNEAWPDTINVSINGYSVTIGIRWVE